MRLWKQLWATRARLGVAALVIVFIAFAAYIAVAYYTGMFPDPDWTGFGPPKVDARGTELPHFKTLWDWLGLLLVPVVIAVAGYLFTRAENNQARRLQEQREKEAFLQAYLDQMTELLLHEKLRTSQMDDEVRSVARARTLTALRVLDGVRKATVLQFLYEAGLIGGTKHETGDVPKTIDAIVSLERADLSEANLESVNLEGANLEGANLKRADLGWANLEGTSLRRADLQGAILVNAHLDRTNFSEAYLAEAHLQLARLYSTNISGARLRNAYLSGAELSGVDLSHFDLSGAHMFGTFLVTTDLRNARLVGVNLQWARLREANLEGANLEGANLRDADLQGANLTHCRVTSKQLARAASLEGAKLPFGMKPPPAPKARGAARKAK